MNRTLRQLLSILVFLVSLLTCVLSRSFAQAGWTQPTVMPMARAAFGAAVGPDGRIYVIGGQFHLDYLDTVSPVDIYDPAKNIWTKGAPLPTSRLSLGVVTGPDGLIYAIGGYDSSGKIVATVEAYNTVTDTWSTITSLPAPRDYLNNSVAVGSDGRIYAIGGRIRAGDPFTGDVLAYDTKTKTWTTKTSTPYTGYPTSAAAGPDGKIYVAFGNSFGDPHKSPFAAYNPATDTWTSLPALPTSRIGMAVVGGQDGLIYVMGGQWVGGSDWHSLAEVDVYDPVTSQWSSATAMPKPSANFPTVSTTDGRFFAFATNEAVDASSLTTRVDTYHLAPTGIFPDHGGKGGFARVTASIILKGAQEGATVKLTASKVPDIEGTNTKTLLLANFKASWHIQTTFDLTSATLGPRYVVITNPDGTVITLPQQFTVEDLKEPLLQTQVLGRSTIRGGAWTTYNVLVQNTGNVDASNVDLRIEFPKYFEWQLVDAKANDIFTGENSTAIGVQLASVPAGSSQTVSLRVKVPDDLKYAHVTSDLMAWVNIHSDARITYFGTSGENRLMRGETLNQEVIEYSGGIDASGILTLTSVSKQIQDGKSTLVNLDQRLRPVLARNQDGTQFVFKWKSDTEVVVTAIWKDGTVLASTTAHLPGSGPRGQGGPPLNACQQLGQQQLELCQKLKDWRFWDITCGVTIALITENPIAVLVLAGICADAAEITCNALANYEQEICNDIAHTPITSVVSGDPNEIAGSAGFGISQWVSALQPLPYTVFFANKPEATAAAQVVRVTDQLDLPGADLSTLSLGTITIGNQTVTPEDHINPIEGVREYDAYVDMRPQKNLFVHVNAKLNLDNGLLTWTFTSLNPITGLPLDPADPNGFLDPGQEGSMLFTVMPRKNLKTGTVVKNQAVIFFDRNAPMSTPVWFNTIDNDKPTSQVNALAGTQNTLTFPVSWKGQDVGSGVRDFTIYVSDNGGAWTVWQSNTMDASATFMGAAGHTYAFYSTARDNVFNLEDTHVLPDTTTTVSKSAGVVDVSSQVTIKRGGFRLNKTTGRFVQTVTLTNTGRSVITGPISLALDGLSSNAALFGKTGTTSATTPTGSPYLDAQAGSMAVGASVTLTLEFTNSDNSKGITYTTRVLAGPGSR